MSLSQQRLTQQSLSKLPRVRDIREASMNEIIFRVLDPFSSSQDPAEPIINISSFDDVITSPVVRPNSLDIKESPSTLSREIRAYARSKTAPLSSSSSGAQQFLTPKRCEARDLCGSSSNDESSSSTSGHNSTVV
jgi:hypothetical protein